MLPLNTTHRLTAFACLRTFTRVGSAGGAARSIIATGSCRRGECHGVFAKFLESVRRLGPRQTRDQTAFRNLAGWMSMTTTISFVELSKREHFRSA